jgi:hypothetical protein
MRAAGQIRGSDFTSIRFAFNRKDKLVRLLEAGPLLSGGRRQIPLMSQITPGDMKEKIYVTKFHSVYYFPSFALIRLVGILLL